MEPVPVVLYISSDEEPGLEEEPKSTDYDWIKELLSMSDGESDDSDEVVVIREVKFDWKSKSSTTAEEDGYDDCVILDVDPENRVGSVDETATGSEELLVVGEKGQDMKVPHGRC